MKKLVSSGLLCGFFISPCLLAQTELDETLVYGHSMEETTPTELQEYGNRLEIITSEQLQNMGFSDLSQPLQMLVPGLNIRPKNGAFDYVEMSLQGSRDQEILWLVDGVRITNRLYNGTSGLDTIPSHMIERIEVLKGGQGIYYGTQAVGGVINIVTKGYREGLEGDISVGASSNSGTSLAGNIRGGSDEHQFVLYLSRDEAEGYTPFRKSEIQPSSTDLDRGYEVNTFGAKYGWQISDNTRLSMQYQRTDADLDFAYPYLNAETYNAREEDIATVKLDHRVSDSAELYVKAYWHNWDTLYTRIRNELDASGDMTGNLLELNRGTYWGYEDYGLNAMAKFNFDQGVEYVVGFDNQNFSGEDDVWVIADQKESVNALYAQIRTLEGTIDNTRLAFGVRDNRPSNTESSKVWNFSGQYDFSPNYYARTNIGTSFRLPDAEQLFLNEYYDNDNDGVPDGGWFAIGNPDLEAEKSRNLNFAVGYQSPRLGAELVYFNRDITNYIDSYVPLEINGVVGESFVNSDDEVNVEGWEFIAGFQFNARWSANFSHSITEAELNNSGSQLSDIPENETKLSIDYVAAALPLGVSLSFDQVGNFSSRGLERGDYLLVDLSAYYQFGDHDQHQLTARIENLTDEIYATSVGRGTLDADGSSYYYDNLGTDRTLHLRYSYRF